MSTVQAERMGSRWLHAHPDETQVKDWFTSQPLHTGMEHGPYFGGIVVISASEKFKETRTNSNDQQYTAEMERAVFVPYVKVDTRVLYFWDLVRKLNGGEEFGDFVGRIERDTSVPRIDDPKSAYYNGHLPEGYFVLPVRNKDNSISRFLGCTAKVAIYKRESLESDPEKAVPLLSGQGTKQTPLAKNWADDNATMKAETGAIGRALGFAGILVVGTGVATAEDMMEAAGGQAGAAAASSEEAVVLPAIVGEQAGPAIEQPSSDPGSNIEEEVQALSDEDLRERAKVLQKELSEGYPQAQAAFLEWYQQTRELGHIDTLTGPVLQGVVIKLERDLDAAKSEPQPDLPDPIRPE